MVTNGKWSPTSVRMTDESSNAPACWYGRSALSCTWSGSPIAAASGPLVPVAEPSASRKS